MTKWNWMISPDSRPRSAPAAESVTVSQDPGAWGLFAFPASELPPPGAPLLHPRLQAKINFMIISNGPCPPHHHSRDPRPRGHPQGGRVGHRTDESPRLR